MFPGVGEGMRCGRHTIKWVLLIFVTCHLAVSSPPNQARVARGAGKRSASKVDGGERSSSSSSSRSCRRSSDSDSDSGSDLLFKRFEGLKKAKGGAPSTPSLRGAHWQKTEISAPKSLPALRTEGSQSESESESEDLPAQYHDDADGGDDDSGGADASPIQGGELCADDARDMVSGKDGDRLLVSGVPKPSPGDLQTPTPIRVRPHGDATLC